MKVCLLTASWGIMFIAAAYNHGAVGCTTGFPDRLVSRVRRAINESVTILIPEMNFTCSGTVVGFTVGGRQVNGEEDPLIQIWRENLSHPDPGVYYKIATDITINGTVCENGLSEESGTSVFHCNLSESFHVSVEQGDILGLEIPPLNNDDFLVYFAHTTKGPLNYVFDSQLLASPISLSNASSVNQLLPQLTLQIEPVDDIITTCSKGFPDIALGIVSAQTHSDVITRIIPEMNFTCNATIFGFMVAGRQLNQSPHAKIQIWRKISDFDYEILSEIKVDTNTSIRNEERVCVHVRAAIPAVFWCVLNDASHMTVQPGDILGLQLPAANNSEVYFADRGPTNYVFSGRVNSTISLLNDNDTEFLKVQQLPQIVLNLTSDHCLSGFLAISDQTGAGRAEGETVTTRLIPEMKFGCNGTIVGYKVVASPNRNGTQHPKIQIWRQNTTHTGLYYKPHPDIPIVHPSPQLFPCDRSSFANGLLQCTLYESARVKVQCGDVLGLELPPLNDDRHEILFRSGGPKNFGYHGNLSTISALTESEADFTTNDTPLITFLVAIDGVHTGTCSNAATDSSPATTVKSAAATTNPSEADGSTTETSNIISTKPQAGNAHTRPDTLAGGVIGGIVLILLVVIVVLTLALVFFVRKNKFRRFPVANGTLPSDSVYRNPVYSAVTNSTQLTNSHDNQQFSEEKDCTQAQDYCEIEDGEKYKSTTVDGLISGLAQPTSNYYCATPQPQEGEYEITTEMYQFQLDDNNYAIQCDDKLSALEATEDALYWKPAATVNELYKQLSSRKYREIGRNQVKLNKVLGSGQFGEVHKGSWESPLGAMGVAVKQLQPGASDEEKVKFLQEAAINGQFRHPNVVQLMGVVTVGEPTMIVLELLSNGDLRSFLLNNQQQSGNTDSITLDMHVLLRFCQHVASGMCYLASKSFVHRDLAARNILVSGDKICKISDFGMSRDLMDENYYVSHGGKVPVKWTAPEAIHYKKYSSSSDVWSFGCVMYEIWSLGHKPFESHINSEVIKMVDKGYRLPPPPGLSKELYKIMIQCWQPLSNQRPTFSQLVELLSRADFEIFSWDEEDLADCDPRARLIGAPLETSKDLYKELQKTYQTHD